MSLVQVATAGEKTAVQDWVRQIAKVEAGRRT
jgi:hypothetical protein